MRKRLRGTGATGRRAGRRFLAALILSAGALDAAPPRAEEVLLIAPHVWEGFEEYKRQKQPKIFAVSADGLTYAYSYCSEYRCRLTPDARTVALNACARGGGKACSVFAVGRDIKVPYQVAAWSIPDLPPEPAATPAPAARDCGSRSEAECAAILADFDERRRVVEAEWAARIQRLRRIHCQYAHSGNNQVCKNQVAAAEAGRDAELQALDGELRLALGM